MANLSTTYMGIKLKSPLILGSSNLVMNKEIPEKLEAAGIGAIVYKSLFEEQIQLEDLQLTEDLTEYENRNAEMVRLFPEVEHAGPQEYLFNISKLKRNLDIPVIASLNAINEPTWIEYARELEKTGVDGLELNLYSVPTYFEETGQVVEDKQAQIVESVKQAVKIPVSVKISPFYTNPLNFIKKIDEAGADAYVLFNRFFHPDIDIIREKFHFPWSLSYRRDYLLALRYAGILYGNLDGSICAGGGIYQSRDMIKMILAGADAVQIVSTVYKNKPEVVSEMLMDLSRWMDEHGYSSIDDFKGKLSRKKLADPFVYQRAQYVDILMKSDDVFKKYPMI